MEVNWFITIPWLPAITTAAYLTVKKKSPSEIIENTVKAMLGYYLICAGAYLAIEAMSPLNARIYGATGTHVGILNTELMGAVLVEKSGNAGFLTFLLAFAVNLLLAKRTEKGISVSDRPSFTVSKLDDLFRDPGKNTAVIAGSGSAGRYDYRNLYLVLRKGQRGLYGKAEARSKGGPWKFRFRRGRHRNGGGPLFSEEKEAGGLWKRGTEYKLCDFDWRDYGICAVSCDAGNGEEPFGSGPLCAHVRSSTVGHRVRVTDAAGKCDSDVLGAWQAVCAGSVTGLDSTAIVSYSPGAWKAGFCAASVTAAIASPLLFVTGSPFAALPGFTSFYFAGGVAGVFGNMEGGKQGAALAGAVTGIAVILLTSGLVFLSGMGVGYGMALGETEYGILGCLLSVVLNVIK